MIGQGSKDDESRSSSERPGVKTFFNQGEMLLQLCFRFMKCAINNSMPGIIIIRVGLCSLHYYTAKDNILWTSHKGF